MVFVGFEPFPSVCPTLSESKNELCHSIKNIILNDGLIYSNQRKFIEQSFIKKIKNNTFDKIKACKAYENLIVRHKLYIIETYNVNNAVLFILNSNIITRTLNKDIRKQITHLLVNNFLEDYHNEIEELIIAQW